MDDLSGLDWSAAPSSQGKKLPPMGSNYQTPSYPSLRATPSPQTSGRNTPLSAQGSGLPGANKSTAPKPATDSFSNLVNFGPAKTNANLSLKERQELLEAEKRRKEEEKRKNLQSQYGSGQHWDSIGQGSAGASRTASPALSGGLGPQNGHSKSDDDDLFAAFNKDTKVDNASFYPPPPSQSISGTSSPAPPIQLNLNSPTAWGQSTTANANANGGDFGDDDDPFGLNDLKPKSAQPAQPSTVDDDDDFLGDLGKPVEEVRKRVQAAQPKPAPAPAPEPGKPIDNEDDSDSDSDTNERLANSSDPFDKAIAEIVDMGFTAENARRGLTESGAGLNVQAAIGWLLDDAHRQARNKKLGRDSPAEDLRQRDTGSRSRDNRSPAWASDDGRLPPRGDNNSPASGDDFSKKAAAMGSSLFKTANSLWKTGQKQVQKAVADFQNEGGDPNQPKWMRAAQQQERSLAGDRQRAIDVTDEAILLESGRRPEKPERQSSRPTRDFEHAPSTSAISRDQSPALPSRPSKQNSPVPRWQQQSPASSMDPRARLNKQVIKEQSAQAYVSPARRKKATPQPQPPVQAEPEPDLLFNSTAPPAAKPQRPSQPSPAASRPSPAITPRPAAPVRQIPHVDAPVLQASTKHRQDGTAHFKRGDYDAAHSAYSRSLSGIPQTHPIAIVLLTNRALTAIKIGSPKQAVEDADNAILIIGPSRGEGEHVALADGEKREMKDLYGKALSRKAEALESMEKWAEAGAVWQLSVEAGVGGASAIAGRQRCQKALAPKPKPAARPPPRPKPSPMADLAASSQSSEAVNRLREANKAAEKADDEKFALSEKVDARISAWRDGKRDNLRALIGSLDQVLWDGSGWKKIGLHELVMANKVKINYMKAIAKTHPDKLPQDATTEVKLIAGTVFATLNEAWDKFKAENGL